MSGHTKIKKAQYYVWYLGWKEVRGVWGREFTEPITRELIHRRRHEDLPKLTIEVSKKELKINQIIEKKKGKTEKIKYPPIPAKDVTYAVEALSPDEDVVACIYLGFNPQTRQAVHVHVYRCDSPETAEMFVDHLTQIIRLPEYAQRVMRIEAELVSKGQIMPRPTAYVGAAPSEAASTRISDPSEDGNPYERRQDMFEEPGKFPPDRSYGNGRYSETEDIYHRDNRYGDSRYRSSREEGGEYSEEEVYDNSGYKRSQSPKGEDADLKGAAEIYDNVAAELKEKLHGIKGPLLLPPKDYDTIHRSAGNLQNVPNRKSLNINIVGPQGAVIKKIPKKDSTDSARGESEGGSQDGKKLRSSWNDDARSGRSSNGSRYRNDSGGEDDEIQAITPRWKMTNQTFIPPNSPRATSPIHQDKKSSRALSPGRYNPPRSPASPRTPDEMMGNGHPPRSPNLMRQPRPMSPPPELRDSYFPTGHASPLPNYLTSERPFYPSDSPSSDRRVPPSRHSTGSDSGGKKYTASTLGLAKEKKPSRGRDEGYLSMDRGYPEEMNNPLFGGGDYGRRGPAGPYDVPQRRPPPTGPRPGGGPGPGPPGDEFYLRGPPMY